ncbi:MAG: chemotaxis protein CheW [Pseudomonadota bacterium]
MEQKTEIGEYLTFELSEQEYAIDIMSVREIRGWAKTTPMPHAPSFMRGVINLRGTVLPVMDLAARIGLAPIEPTSRNVVIVAKFESALTGLLVDSVSDIISIHAEDRQLPPDNGTGAQDTTIEALTLIEERMIRILGLPSVLAIGSPIAA